MVVYVYDGSFEGLLTAVYEAYYREMPQRIVSRENLQISLLDEYKHIDTDMEKSDKVYDSIKRKISDKALKDIYHVFLSDIREAGNLIFDYLKIGWKVGKNIDSYLCYDIVLEVHKISQRVEYETHKMLGFVRFKLIDGNIYYAPIEPDNNIIALIAPHFAERLADQNWIIHDKKRSLAVIYDRKEWVMANIALDRLPAIMESELLYQGLWKEFFNSIAIPNRINPGLQKRFMPVRYWRYLTEKL